MKYIKRILEFNNQEINVDFGEFPEDVLKTLNDEYGHVFAFNFDWNEKQDEYMDDMPGFSEWLKQNSKEEFIKNLDKLITLTRKDLILLKRKELAKEALRYFEELIKPTLGKDVLTEPLSKYMEIALMNNHNLKDIEKAFRDAKNIIDSDGSINQLKTTPSKIFIGGDINEPAFERFVKENPEYQGVYNDWKKLSDKEIDLILTPLNAFRDTVGYDRIKKLHDFLIGYRNKLK